MGHVGTCNLQLNKRMVDRLGRDLYMEASKVRLSQALSCVTRKEIGVRATGHRTPGIDVE